MTNQSIAFLKKLIWEKYFRHYGRETKTWKYKQCISLVERLKKTGYLQPPSPRTLYNFSKTGKASDYTLSTLVHAVYNDNKDFIEYFDTEYQGNDELKWEAFVDFTSKQSDIQNNRKIVSLNKKYSQIKVFNDLNDPLLFIYRKAKGNIPIIFALFFFINSVAVITLAVILGVWKNIDYPLSQSYTVWIGYMFFAGAATFFTLFIKQLSLLLTYTNGDADDLILHLSSIKVKLYLLILAIVIATLLHYSFLTDTIQGWCESKPGKLSFLGIYHLILYAFNLWISFLFIFYYINIGKIINMLAETRNNDTVCNNIESVISLLANLNIYYKIIIITFGGFAILFFTTTILFIKNHSNFSLYLWHWIEIGILTILYAGFGFILYWRYFSKRISDFLIAERNKQLMKKHINQQEMVYALTLPSNPDETNQYAANILNVLIWMTSICLLFLIGVLLYLSN